MKYSFDPLLVVSYRTKLPHHLCFRQWFIRALLGLPLPLCSLKLMIREIAVLLKRSKTYSDLMNLLNDSTFMTVAGNSLCTNSTKPSQLHSQSVLRKKGDMARSTVRLASGFWSVCVAKSSKTGCPPTVFACLAKAFEISWNFNQAYGKRKPPLITMNPITNPLLRRLSMFSTRMCNMTKVNEMQNWICSEADHFSMFWSEGISCTTTLSSKAGPAMTWFLSSFAANSGLWISNCNRLHTRLQGTARLAEFR